MTLPQLRVALAALALAGCPALSSEPPPPPRKPEIPTAPPRALGALAAGTDAAPRPDVTLALPDGEALPEAPAAPPTAPDPAPDGGAPLPKSPSPAPKHAPPDGGMAL